MFRPVPGQGAGQGAGQQNVYADVGGGVNKSKGGGVNRHHSPIRWFYSVFWS